ncbi:MAG: diguanylate cyclase [Candidatus Tectomicrobia bacterium]|nr:diguanylate cyclase [Candidatus Tectomicrobia bacterium]
MESEKTLEQERPLKALVIDDEAMVLDVVKGILSHQEYLVTTCITGDEAFKHLEEEPFDVILSDWKLPDIDGIEFLRKARGIQPYVATILITGHGSAEAVVKAFKDGQVNNYLSKPFQNYELERVVNLSIREQRLKQREENFLKELEKRVQEVTIELEQKNILLEKLSITDGLTGLYNQRHFYQELQKEIKRAMRQKRPLSLLLFDIDHFKVFNDSYGHQEGDKILSRVGEMVREQIRAHVDSGYRYGGEEFTIILPETDEKHALIVAERLRRACEKINSKKVTISIGISAMKEGDDEHSIVQRADIAMYHAKRTGRNRASLESQVFP